MQVLLIVEADGSGNGRQGLAFELTDHAQMEKLEGFKATHLRKQVSIELAVLIDKVNGCLGVSGNRHLRDH